MPAGDVLPYFSLHFKSASFCTLLVPNRTKRQDELGWRCGGLMNRRISSSIPNLVALAQNLPSTLTFSESRHHTHSSQQRTGWTENLRTQLSGTSTLRRPLFKPWGRRGGLPPPTMRGVPDWVTLCTNASVSVQRQRIGAEREAGEIKYSVPAVHRRGRGM